MLEQSYLPCRRIQCTCTPQQYACPASQTRLTCGSFAALGVNRCPGTTSTGYCAIWASDFANGLGGPCTVAPVLQTPADPTVTNYQGKGTTAWTINTFDGRELLVATYDCAAW